MITRIAFICILLAVAINLTAQKTNIDFAVLFKDDKIGTLHAENVKEGVKSVTNVRTETETTVLFLTFHLESEVNIVQEKGILTTGTAYRNANRGPDDVESTITRAGRYYVRERSGDKDKIKIKRIRFCVANLYFQEPVRVRKVFSNMYGEMLKLKKIRSGKYQLMTPDSNTSFYNYENGKLMSIEVTTPVGEVITKRV